ncbi:MAG: McrBC 5-methylcytosine restriction system component-like protein [Candidatus Ruthia sp. Asou_11_S2]|nr:McrBC 5-methylcytosine restriction system component-like protein [Candidatus Ruthia sp. Asou_11_S2]
MSNEIFKSIEKNNNKDAVFDLSKANNDLFILNNIRNDINKIHENKQGKNKKQNIFAWVKWFGELVTIISSENKNTLSIKINQAIEDKAQSIIKFGAYDPFSFFYFLAKKNTTHQKKLFFQSVDRVFNVSTSLPNFDNNDCWIFPTPTPHSNVLYKWDNKYEPELLWDFSQQIISIKNVDELATKATDDEFVDDFKTVLDLTSVGVPKLTQTLFLINPNVFFTIDWILKPISHKLLDNPSSDTEKNIKQLRNSIETEGFSAYLKIMQKIHALFPNKTPYEINHKLWENGECMDDKLEKAISVLKNKKQVILQGSPGTGKTRTAKKMSELLVKEKVHIEKTEEHRNTIFFDYLSIGLIVPVEGNEYCQEIQITNIEISQEKEDDTFIETKKGSYEKISYIEIQKNGSEPTTLYIPLLAIINNSFDKQNNYKGTAISFSKFISLQKILQNRVKLIQFHPAYSYEYFVRGIVAKTDDNGNISYEVKNKILADMADNKFNNPDENFVLIIDEINPANLSSVLGKLIYALEYRGEAVESMYEYQESREIILPKNLYIIGTMNTADRSVGHIDYAIRRRFAFINVLTDRNVIEQYYLDSLSLFDKVEELFDKKISEEFDKNDVMIGHSYFLTDNLQQALKYEIKPILFEYLKDGVLTCEKSVIDNLDVD